MPNYTYNCSACGRIELNNVPVDERKQQACPHCGAALEFIFDPRGGLRSYVPIRHQATHNDDLFPPNGLEPQNEAQRRIQEECGACPPSRGWN